LDTVIEIYIARAQAYEFAKEFDKALSDYTSAIAENPDDSKAYRLRAQFYSTIMKDVDRAIADYTRILTIEPRHIGVLMDRGVAFLQKSLYDQALDDFKKVIEIDPQYGSAYIQLSIIMLKKGDFPAALQDAEQAIRLTSNEPGVQWAAFKVGGDASLALGHRDEAIRYYRQASALASRYPILRTQAEEAMRDAFKTLGITP
jgi:tetratricopeptide (TPR) repeat protein